MKNSWKKLDVNGRRGRREILHMYYDVQGLDEANQKAQLVLRAVSESLYPQEEVSLSMHSHSVHVVLHGVSEGPVTESDWEVSRRIDGAQS